MASNALQFYAAISFECPEAALLILRTTTSLPPSGFVYASGYGQIPQSSTSVALLDSINGFLSRENPGLLQLYAAKCLANLCRSMSELNAMAAINATSTATITKTAGPRLSGKQQPQTAVVTSIVSRLRRRPVSGAGAAAATVTTMTAYASMST